MTKIKLPYLPAGKTIQYKPLSDTYIQLAKKSAENFSKDPNHKTGAVIVKDGKVIGQGANGSDFHTKIGCPRKFFGIPTGKLYAICPGCNPINHAEQVAIRNAIKNGHNPNDADLYLYGHWWCCQWCWAAMIKANIKNVYLPENAHTYFQ